MYADWVDACEMVRTGKAPGAGLSDPGADIARSKEASAGSIMGRRREGSFIEDDEGADQEDDYE